MLIHQGGAINTQDTTAAIDTDALPLDDEVEELEDEQIDPIVQALIKEREVRGWSQADVGRRLGHAGGQAVQQWETGKVTPRLDTLRAWMAVFGLSLRLDRPVVRGRPRTNFPKS